MKHIMMILLAVSLMWISGCRDETDANSGGEAAITTAHPENAEPMNDSTRSDEPEQPVPSAELHFKEVQTPSGQMKELLDDVLKYEEGVTSYHHEDQQTYILLKAPKYNQNVGVQFKGFEFEDHIITVHYRFTAEEPAADYLLYAVDGVHKVIFQEVDWHDGLNQT